MPYFLACLRKKAFLLAKKRISDLFHFFSCPNWSWMPSGILPSCTYFSKEDIDFPISWAHHPLLACVSFIMAVSKATSSKSVSDIPQGMGLPDSCALADSSALSANVRKPAAMIL